MKKLVVPLIVLCVLTGHRQQDKPEVLTLDRATTQTITPDKVNRAFYKNDNDGWKAMFIQPF